MAEVSKSINNLYAILDIDGDEILTETPLNIITEKDLLKFNIVFSKIVDMMEKDSNSLVRTLATGFNSVIFNIFNDNYKDEDIAYDKTKEFEIFINSLVLNTKIYYRGKELSFNEFYATKDDKTLETNMRFNVCFFLSMFIVLSNTLKLEKVKNLTEIQKGICYLGSSSIGEFHSFVQNLKAELSSANV